MTPALISLSSKQNEVKKAEVLKIHIRDRSKVCGLTIYTSGHVHMMSAVGRGGGTPKADAVREVA